MTTCEYITGPKRWKRPEEERLCGEPATVRVLMSDGVRSFAMCKMHVGAWVGFKVLPIAPVAEDSARKENGGE